MKTDLHIHTAPCSGCASMTPEQMVATYIKEGYSTVVVTNHFTPDTVERARDVGLELSEFYLADYRTAKKAAEGTSLTVLLGSEIRVAGSPNDYLVYGMDEEFFRDEKIVFLRVGELCRYCHDRSLLIYQAHPFRDHMQVTSPSRLDGIEVHNGNPRHDSRNDVAAMWADKFGLKRVSGSDYHDAGDESRGGIITETAIGSSTELIEVLLEGNYEIIGNAP